MQTAPQVPIRDLISREMQAKTNDCVYKVKCRKCETETYGSRELIPIQLHLYNTTFQWLQIRNSQVQWEASRSRNSSSIFSLKKVKISSCREAALVQASAFPCMVALVMGLLMVMVVVVVLKRVKRWNLCYNFEKWACGVGVVGTCIKKMDCGVNMRDMCVGKWDSGVGMTLLQYKNGFVVLLCMYTLWRYDHFFWFYYFLNFLQLLMQKISFSKF